MNIGILGAGNIAGNMARTLHAMEDAAFYAVGARDKERAEAFAKKYGAKKAYGSYEELVNDPEVELIYIATPHSHHFEHAKLCIEHGKPVLCEKAFMANAEQAREICKLAEERNVFLTEAIWTRYLPSRKMIDEVIQRGEMGEVTFVTANLGYDIKDVERIWNPALAGGGLLDIGIYPLTFISMVLGNDIKEIVSTCTKTETGVDEQCAIILKYENGVMAVAHCSILCGTEQAGFVYGTGGYLMAENINNVTGIKVYTKDRKFVKEYQVPEQITGFEYQVRASMKAIREGKLECEEIPHAESIFMMELMDKLRADWGIRYPFE